MAERQPCPVAGCERKCWPWQAMCARHWWTVPRELRNRLWGLYREAAGTPEHLQVLAEAIAAATPASERVEVR